MTRNKIAARQNEQGSLTLLAARRAIYARGKRLLLTQFSLVVAFPIVASLLTLPVPDLKPTVAFLALCIAVLDTLLLDRLQKNIRKTAAKIQEHFDCDVLEIPWDNFEVGAKVEAELVYESAQKYARRSTDAELRDWYPPAVGELPIYLARIVCQRTNLWYDAKLRKQFGNLSLAVSLGLVFLLLLTGTVGGFSLSSLVLGGFAPAAPMILWGIRERYRQQDATDAIERIKQEAEKLWQTAAIIGSCDESDCVRLTRQLQNAIYHLRSNSPMILDLIYWRQRASLEDLMNKGAAELTRQALEAERNRASLPAAGLRLT